MLTTNVDKILNILKEKKEVMINELAQTLNTTPSNIEKIAKMLEEEKLVTIRYKMMKPYLVYGFKEKKKKEEEKLEEIKERIPSAKKNLFVWKGKPISLFKKKEPTIQTPLSELKEKPLSKVPKESLFTKLFKKKSPATTKPFPALTPKPLPRLETKPMFPFLKKEKEIPKLAKKPFFLFLKKKKKETGLEEVKEAIQRAKGIRLERKPISVLNVPRFDRPVELKQIKEELIIGTEEDTIKEMDNLINECKKQKDKNLIKRNYKKALALYNKLKNTENQIDYNKKLKDIYDKLTK